MNMLVIMAVLIIGTWIGMAFVLFKTKIMDENE